jgi:hypothetical protein
MTTPITSKYKASWIGSLAIQLPLADAPAWVKILPVNDAVGRPYLPYDAYIHDAQRPDQIPLNTTHLAYVPVRGGTDLEIAPISRWWAVGAAAAVPSTGIANLKKITDLLNARNHWDDPATLVELNPAPGRLTWQTGYKHNGDWRHLDRGFPLDEVIKAVNTGLTFKDLAS